MNVLVTGAAGFIGERVCDRLLSRPGTRVTGVDNLDPYYDVRLKRYRLNRLRGRAGFRFHRSDVRDLGRMRRILRSARPEAVVHLAAMTGVRHSLEQPAPYFEVNALGAARVLECCRELKVRKTVLASTSSLYAGCRMPFTEGPAASRLLSGYAASKAAAEDVAAAYGRLYGLDVTVVRYFTVYGPAGRPDMSPYRFIEWIRTGNPVRLNGSGSQKRDFTYVEDIAEGTVLALGHKGPEVFNLGGDAPRSLLDLIRVIEREVGRKAVLRRCEQGPGEMRETWADIRKARRLLGWNPRVRLEEGIRRTVRWHLEQRRMLDRARF